MQSFVSSKKNIQRINIECLKDKTLKKVNFDQIKVEP